MSETQIDSVWGLQVDCSEHTAKSGGFFVRCGADAGWERLTCEPARDTWSRSNFRAVGLVAVGMVAATVLWAFLASRVRLWS